MAQLSLTVVDGLVIGVVLISAAFAALRGLVRETFAILQWLAGGYVALRFTPEVQPLLKGAIPPPWLEWLLVFIGIFLIVFIPLALISRRVSDMVKHSDVGMVDRVLGLLFGVARGLVIVGLVYMTYAALVPQKNHPASLTQARSYRLIRVSSEILRELVPAAASDAKGNGDQGGAATKTAGARLHGTLDTLFGTNEGSGTSQ